MRSLVVMFALLWAPAHAPTPADQLVDNADAAQDRGDWDEALKLLRRATKLDPTHRRAQLRLAKLHTRRHAHAEAAAAYQAALDATDASQPAYADIAVKLGAAHVRRGEQGTLAAAERTKARRRALEAFGLALARRPTDHKTLYRRARVHDKLGDPDAADADFRRCIRLAPSYASCFVSLAFLYMDYGFSNEAIAVLEAGIKENERDVDLWTAMGAARATLHQYARAIEAYETAETIDPDAPPTLFGLGMAFVETSKRGDAIATLERYLAVASSDDEHRQRIARDSIARMRRPP